MTCLSGWEELKCKEAGTGLTNRPGTSPPGTNGWQMKWMVVLCHVEGSGGMIPVHKSIHSFVKEGKS